MKIATVIKILLLFLLVSCAQIKKSQQPRQMPNAIPVLHIINDRTATAIKISSLDIDVKVAANIATTVFDIILYNPNDRILEGELEFPLADGQSIVRYALDIEGKLREGVVIEKAKARVAFENTIHQNIDPGLVEKTKGNNFRTRIYPLPAKGTRHILIAVEQGLELLNKDLLYQLPLYATEPMNKFAIKATIIKSDKKPVMQKAGLENFDFEKQQTLWQAAFTKNSFLANQTIAFTIPNSSQNENTILTENYNGQTYFYVNNRVEADYEKKAAPKTIGLFWDNSGSGDKRNIEKEKQLLKEYLSKIGEVTVSFIPFNIITQSKEDFDIKNGISDALLNRVKELKYDGGTQFGSIDLNKYNFDEVLLFSDGLATFGKKEIAFSNIPIISINSSASADFSFLKYAAQQSHGKFIDLSKLEINTALEEITSQSLQVLNIEYNPTDIEELAIQVSPIQSSGLSFAGKLKTNSATVKINIGFGNDIKISRIFTINKPDSSEYNAVKRIWASMKIAGLDLQFEKNKDAITKLGKEFSIVTQNTSLIVLDRVEDYVEHEITPPEELQKEYYTLLKQKQKEDKDKEAAVLNEALDAMRGLKEWWHKNYSPAKKPHAEDLITITNQQGVIVDSLVTGSVNYAAPVIVADGQVGYLDIQSDSSGRLNSRVFGLTVTSDTLRYNYSTEGIESSAVPFMRISPDADADGIIDTLEQARKPEEEKNEIKANKWRADELYLNELEKTPGALQALKYFELKKKYGGLPAFFIDVARFFIEKNEKQFGLLILSNVAEMKLESPELMRMMANQLLELGEKELSVETFKDVLKMREEDPQSYRDLALAYNETGQYNEAIELLYKVITGSWDSRFGEVKAIAINEMNAIISVHKEMVNTTAIDNHLIYAMPVDVRIVIGWSSDNSDIDLWVTDPRNEKCFYSHNETEIGGKISQDVTQGFGPEEFCLKHAWKGKYKVEVNLFGDRRQTIGGPIAIKADLFTDYGKPTQKRETINFRVKTNKEIIELGTLKFGI